MPPLWLWQNTSAWWRTATCKVTAHSLMQALSRHWHCVGWIVLRSLAENDPGLGTEAVLLCCLQRCMWHQHRGCWRQQARTTSKGGWLFQFSWCWCLLSARTQTTAAWKAASSHTHSPPVPLCLCACSPAVLDPATVCSAKLQVQDAAILALSADQLLLACVAGSQARIYSLPQLLSHQSDLPVHTLQMDQPVLQFSWCPADSTQFLALTSERVLHHGSLTTGSATLAEHVECASWAPDGQHVAYSSGSKLVVTGVDWKDTAFKVDLPPPEEGEGTTALQCF